MLNMENQNTFQKLFEFEISCKYDPEGFASEGGFSLPLFLFN